MELVAHINNVVIPNLSAPSGAKDRLFAGASLARSSRLLGAILTLFDTGFVDAVGALLRQILECWFVGEYLLLAPEEAMQKLVEANKYQMEKMGNAGWEDLGEFAAAFDVDSRQINWATLAGRIGELFEEWGHEGAANRGKDLYDMIYRSQSLLSVHAGVGSFAGHVEVHEKFSSISEVRTEPGLPMMPVLMAASLVCWLGVRVSEEFGIGTARLESLLSDISTSLQRIVDS